MPAASASCPGRNEITTEAGLCAASPRHFPPSYSQDDIMDVGLFAQYVMNGLMLGMMYALVAVGFTLFFGVLDIIKFSHGDVLTVGAFAALATFAGLHAAGFNSQLLYLVIVALGASAQYAADHVNARHGAARTGAVVLSAGRQSKTVSGAAAAKF